MNKIIVDPVSLNLSIFVIYFEDVDYVKTRHLYMDRTQSNMYCFFIFTPQNITTGIFLISYDGYWQICGGQSFSMFKQISGLMV